MDKFSTTDKEGDDRGGSGGGGFDNSVSPHAQNPFSMRHKRDADQSMQWKLNCGDKQVTVQLKGKNAFFKP